MKKVFNIYILFFVLCGFACSDNATAQKEILPVGNSRVSEKDKTNDKLQKQIAEIAADAKGRVGIKAVNLQTAEIVSLDENGHFPMQSVYKLPIGMAVLRQVNAGKIKLDQKVRIEKSDFARQGQVSPIRDKNPNGVELSVEELIYAAVSESDTTASDALLKIIGGAVTAQTYLEEIGVDGMMILNSEKEIGQDWETQYRNWASPNGAIKLLRTIYEQTALSKPSTLLIEKFLTETNIKPGRVKGLLPKDAVVAHKTGTSGSKKGITAATNDIGIIKLPNGGAFMIAVFVSDSTADEATREKTIARIARAVWDEWNK